MPFTFLVSARLFPLEYPGWADMIQDKTNLVLTRTASPYIDSNIMRPLQNAPLLPNSGVRLKFLILKILNVFLWLKLSPFLVLNKIEHFSKVSIYLSDMCIEDVTYCYLIINSRGPHIKHV